MSDREREGGKEGKGREGRRENVLFLRESCELWNRLQSERSFETGFPLYCLDLQRRPLYVELALWGRIVDEERERVGKCDSKWSGERRGYRLKSYRNPLSGD